MTNFVAFLIGIDWNRLLFAGHCIWLIHLKLEHLWMISVKRLDCFLKSSSQVHPRKTVLHCSKIRSDLFIVVRYVQGPTSSVGFYFSPLAIRSSSGNIRLTTLKRYRLDHSWLLRWIFSPSDARNDCCTFWCHRWRPRQRRRPIRQLLVQLPCPYKSLRYYFRYQNLCSDSSKAGSNNESVADLEEVAAVKGWHHFYWRYYPWGRDSRQNPDFSIWATSFNVKHERISWKWWSMSLRW